MRRSCMQWVMVYSSGSYRYHSSISKAGTCSEAMLELGIGQGQYGGFCDQ